MDKKQFKELLDAFYGSLERFVCEYDTRCLRYSFFGKRAASFIRLVAYVAGLAGGQVFALEFGRAISSRWKVLGVVNFEIPSDAVAFKLGKADRIDVRVTDQSAEVVVGYKDFKWAVSGRPGNEKEGGAIALTLNEAKMRRYKV